MQFALLNNQKVKPIKGQMGYCPMCGAEMIARCGKVKIHHWAHKGKLHCDRWWESETLWHRDWKNHFPSEWHEIVHFDDNVEKHIADLKTPHGLVVEFQHSPISTEEKQSREDFYKTMIWIVDGTRRKRDRERFFSGSRGFLTTVARNTYLVKDPKIAFPSEWTYSKSIVFFDFGIHENGTHTVYMLYKTQKAQYYQFTVIDKTYCINLIINGSLLKLMNESAVKKQQPNSSSTKSNQWIQNKGKFIKKRRW